MSAKKGVSFAEGTAADAEAAVAPLPLKKQDLATLDITKLTPMSPEVISRQATINIGTIGHVAHGKSTVVKAISGVKTIRFKSELVRNITIKLGYANAKIYRSVEPPYVYETQGSGHPDEYESDTGRAMHLVRHVSFVDCPGHDILMATMLNGAAVMDGALLLVAGNEPCPQPQTSEHVAAVGIMQLKHIIVLQNKIDLVKEDAARAGYDQIREFMANSDMPADTPIIPISAQLRYNIDLVAKCIVNKIPIPVRDFLSPPRLIVIRSFDVNKPGEEVKHLKGGVAGGSILQGVLKRGDEIEIRPGRSFRDATGKVKVEPIFSRVLSLFAEKNDLEFAVPGGLIGVGTQMDPTLTRADRLVGQVLGTRGTLPHVFTEIEVNFYLLRLLLGVKTSDGKAAKVARLTKDETLMVNIGSTSTGGRVISVKGDAAKLALTSPVCTKEDEKIALSRRIDKHFRLIGWGRIIRGTKLELDGKTA